MNDQIQTKAVTSFESFYQAYYTKAYRLAVSKIGQTQDAEDIVCDTFLYCYDHYHLYDPQKASLGTWLYMVLNSRIKNYYRDRKEHTDYDYVSNMVSDEALLEEAAEFQAIREFLSQAISELKPLQKRIIVLRFFHHMDINQISLQVGMNPGNVRTTLSRSVSKLKERFKAAGILED